MSKRKPKRATAFHDNSAQLIDQLKATHRAITLTIDGKHEVML